MRKAVSLAALVLSTGCATIMQGSHQNVGISSAPTGATILVDNQPMGTTPATVRLTRKDNHVVRLQLAGYQPYEMALSRKTSGWVWGNLVFGGIPGLAVDAITGGLYKLTPEDVNATLAAGQTSMSVDRRDQMVIAVVLAPQPGWEKVGQLARN
jgi:hypothetical protein